MLLLALLVAVLSLTAVGFFTSRISQGVRAQAAEVLAADLRLESPTRSREHYFARPAPAACERANPDLSHGDIQRRREPAGGAQRGDRQLSVARPRAHRRRALRRRPRPPTAFPAAGEVWIDARIIAQLKLALGACCASARRRFA